MADMRIEQALSEMRAIGAQQSQGQQEEGTPPLEDFSHMLEKAVEQVNEQQVASGELKKAYMSGEDVPLTDVMVASQEAKLSFEAMKEVRNHFLKAYREIANMKI